MHHATRDNYLVTEVMTATPQKLQLMLIEAALRFGHQAQVLWQEGRDDDACEAIIRCQQIVSELLCGLNPEHNPDLVRRVAGVYLFVFRGLTAAQLERDTQRLADALSVLEVERETWRQVCEQLGTTRAADMGMEASQMSFEA
ncbi:MAG: flagellar export chaperone FliS [Pirellulales bacterium]|nr:flagellar export chaperone FliS [Pirellulales bacterium]